MRSRASRLVLRTSPAVGPLLSRRGPPYPVDPSDPVLVPLRGEIARRIARVCDGMEPATFARLVQAMAVFRRRWEPRQGFFARGA